MSAGQEDTLIISGLVLPRTGILSDSVNKAYVAKVDTIVHNDYYDAPAEMRDSVLLNVNCDGLTLTKTADKLSACVNDSVTFTIVVTNDNPNAVLDVSVKDEWAQVLSDPVFVYYKTTATFASGTVDWNIVGMFSGQKDTLIVAGRVLRRGTGLASDTINRAYVAKAGTIVHGSYAAALAEMKDSVSISVNCEGLTLSKTADNTNLCVNDSVTFTIVAKNDGTVSLLNVKVNDEWAQILSNADIISTTGTTVATYNSGTGTVEWTIGTMSVGHSDTLIVAGRVLTSGSGLTSDTVNRAYVTTTGTTVQPTYADAPANMRDSVILIVGALPTINFAPVDSVCIGNLPLTLTASATPLGGTGTFSGYGVSGDAFNPSKSGKYTVTYTYVSPNGCVDSASAEINVISVPIVPDIRLKLCPAVNKEIRLSAFLDSTAGDITWTQVYASGITLLDATTGRIRGTFEQNHTYTFKYTLSLASCGSTSARLTLNTTKIDAIRQVDTIAICPTVDSNVYVQLNQILGFELDGTWTYDNTLNPDNTVSDNVTLHPASSRFAGALTLNVAQAWRDAGSAYNMTYNGDNQAKKFVFRYTPASGSCLTKTRTIVIVATPMWL